MAKATALSIFKGILQSHVDRASSVHSNVWEWNDGFLQGLLKAREILVEIEIIENKRLDLIRQSKEVLK